jgi:NTE family protein
MAKKTALVISGGGSKGAFAVGVVKYIFENRPSIKFDMVCGTSTGALMTPLIATKELALMEQIYTTKSTPDIVDTTRVGKRFLQGANSIFDGEPLVRLAQETYTQARYDTILQSGTDIFINTVCLQTQKVVAFSNKDMPLAGQDYEVIKIADRDELIRAIIASASQPFFMSPINIRATDAIPRQYVDGGLREYLSIQLAIDNGATDIYAVALSPKDQVPDNVKQSSLIDILKLSVDIFSTDVGVSDVKIPQIYNQGLKYIDEVKAKMRDSGMVEAQIESLFTTNTDNPFQNKKHINIHIIRPDKKLKGGMGGLEFIPTDMMEMKINGEETAQKYFQDLDLGNIVV